MYNRNGNGASETLCGKKIMIIFEISLRLHWKHVLSLFLYNFRKTEAFLFWNNYFKSFSIKSMDSWEFYSMNNPVLCNTFSTREGFFSLYFFAVFFCWFFVGFHWKLFSWCLVSQAFFHVRPVNRARNAIELWILFLCIDEDSECFHVCYLALDGKNHAIITLCKPIKRIWKQKEKKQHQPLILFAWIKHLYMFLQWKSTWK